MLSVYLVSKFDVCHDCIGRCLVRDGPYSPFLAIVYNISLDPLSQSCLFSSLFSLLFYLNSYSSLLSQDRK